MVMPKNNGTATATPCGKTSMTIYPYNAPAGDTYQQMALPMSGQYPVASKFSAIEISFILIHSGVTRRAREGGGSDRPG